MRRKLALILAAVATAGVMVAVTGTSSSAVPASACRVHNSTQNNQNSWEYSSTFDWHFTQRLNTTSGCGQIYMDSKGWRFNAYQCGEMWVRRYRSDGTSYVVEGSRRTVCGQRTVLLISRIAAGRPFRVEGFPFDAEDRENPQIWPVGAVRY